MQATRVRIDVPRTKRVPSSEVAAPQVSSPAVKAENRGKAWGRLFRWIIGAAMLVEAGWLVAPTFLFHTSIRATVTAPAVAVRIHQEGVVHGTPPAVGTAVTAGQTLFEIQPAAPDGRPSERIRAEIESIRRAADAMKVQIAELDGVKTKLSRHFSEYRDARTAQAEKQAAEQTARVNQAAARLKTAETEHRMQKRLSSRGASSEIELTRAENAMVEAGHELEVARHAAARQQLQLDAARRGLFVGEADGGQDRVASRQRCDEIEIQQAGLRARLGELEGRLHELDARLASEERYLAGSRRAIVAPISGVVWSSTLAPGSEVAAGSMALEIVDPTRLTIEALFKESAAERIRPGEAVRARVLGSPRILRGRIVRVTDSGGIEPGTIAGAPRDPAPAGTFRAIIKPDEPPAAGDTRNRYQVGGSATVWTTR